MMAKKKKNATKRNKPKGNKPHHLFKNRYLISGGVIAAVTLLFGIYIFFLPNFKPRNEEDKVFLYLRKNTQLKEVLTLIKQESSINSEFSFQLASTILRYNEVHPGRYKISRNMSNFKLIRALRSGNQTPVQLSFNNIRTKEQLAGRLAKQLMTDSITFAKLFNDTTFLKRYDLNPNTAVALFIPNTYEVFWTIEAEKLFERMKKEYDQFWTSERKAKAKAIPMTQIEVSTLASIVEEETNGKSERPMVAGLYINRLKTEMPLQADPTVKFAVGDFTLRRITGQHLRKRSPYNTYLNTGLPPGPIRIASPEGIDAILNYKQHNYLFMCAKETLNGEHNFAVTYEEHQVNAKKYQQALNARKIFE